jgi:hypothetical protein
MPRSQAVGLACLTAHEPTSILPLDEKGRLQSLSREVVERLAASIEDFHLYAPDLDIVPLDSPTRTRYRGKSFGLEMHEAYADSAIAVHIAGDEVRDFASARRHFEIAGAGSLLMTEAQPGLDRLFEPGKEL